MIEGLVAYATCTLISFIDRAEKSQGSNLQSGSQFEHHSYCTAPHGLHFPVRIPVCVCVCVCVCCSFVNLYFLTSPLCSKFDIVKKLKSNFTIGGLTYNYAR